MNNLVFHACTKHIEIDYHFICDHIKLKEICIHHINSKDDIFTKPIPTPMFSWQCDKLILKEHFQDQLEGADKTKLQVHHVLITNLINHYHTRVLKDTSYY